MSTKYVYLFSEGNGKMKNLLGGKGANLAEMTNLGMPVPQGFTVTTEACTRYYEDGEKIHAEIIAEVFENLGKLTDVFQIQWCGTGKSVCCDSKGYGVPPLPPPAPTL